MQKAMNFDWTTSKQPTPNEIFQDRGKRGSDKRGIQTQTPPENSRTTKGGQNPSIYCYILSLVAGFSTVLPMDISWATNHPFYGLICKARKKPLQDWGPRHVALTAFNVTSKSQQDASEMAQILLQQTYEVPQLQEFTNGCMTTLQTTRESCPCGKAGKRETHNYPLVKCQLREGAATLAQTLERQAGLSECANRKCNRSVRDNKTVESTGNILIAQFERKRFPNGRCETMAPTAVTEFLLVKGKIQRFELRSVVLHCPTSGVVPDSDDLPFTDFNRGHYACMEVVSQDSVILHNDSEVQKISGNNILGSYARKIVLCFYEKVAIVTPPPLPPPSIEVPTVGGQLKPDPKATTPDGNPPIEVPKVGEQPKSDTPDANPEASQTSGPTLAATASLLGPATVPRPSLRRPTSITALAMGPFIASAGYVNTDLELPFDKTAKVIGLAPRGIPTNTLKYSYRISVKNHDDLTLLAFDDKHGESSRSELEFNPETKRFRNIPTNEVMTYSAFTEQLRGEHTRHIGIVTSETPPADHTSTIAASTIPSEFLEDINHDLASRRGADATSLITNILESITKTLKLQAELETDLEYEKWASILQLLCIFLEPRNWSSAKACASQIHRLRSQVGQMLIRFRPTLAVAKTLLQSCQLPGLTSKHQASCLRHLGTASLGETSIRTIFLTALEGCKTSTSPSILNAGVRTIRRILSMSAAKSDEDFLTKSLTFLISAISHNLDKSESNWAKAAYILIPKLVSENNDIAAAMETLQGLLTTSPSRTDMLQKNGLRRAISDCHKLWTRDPAYHRKHGTVDSWTDILNVIYEPPEGMEHSPLQHNYAAWRQDEPSFCV